MLPKIWEVALIDTREGWLRLSFLYQFQAHRISLCEVSSENSQNTEDIGAFYSKNSEFDGLIQHAVIVVLVWRRIRQKRCMGRRVWTTAVLVGYVNQLVIQLTDTIYLVKQIAKSFPLPSGSMEKHFQTSQSCRNLFADRAKDEYAILWRSGRLLFKRSLA